MSFSSLRGFALSPRLDQHYLLYMGGDQTYNLTQYGSNDSVHLNINENLSGMIAITSTNADPLGGLVINGSDTNPTSIAVGINLGNLIADAIIVNSLGSASFVVGSISSDYNIAGLGVNDRVIFYATEAYGQTYTMGFTTLILNGSIHSDNTQPVSTVIDYGGNETWAGAAPLTYKVYGGYLPDPENGMPALEDSRLIAGNLTGTFSIDDIQSNSSAASNPSFPHLDIILNVYQQANDKPSYTVTQNTVNNISLFQETGHLTFRGINTIIALNSDHIAQTASNLTLTGNDQLWNGNGAADITTQNDQNIIVNSGRGGLIIHNENNTTQGTLSIGNNGLGTGIINYTQGAENVTITGQSSNMLAALGSGTATVDLQNYTTDNIMGAFSITLGTGNEIFKNFTDSAGINLNSQNHLYLASGQTITNVSYDNISNSTIFSLNTNNQITFTGTDLSQQNPFG